MSYSQGQWKACCDRCGFDKLSSELRKEWTGLRVCSECWEPRHPQDFVKGVPDDQTVPWARPEPDPVYVGGPYIREDGSFYWREIGVNLPLLRETGP